MLGASVVVTFVVGSASVVVLPLLRSTPAPATIGVTTLEQASLDDVARPVSAVIAEQDAAADDLKLRAQKIARIKESDTLPAGSGQGRRIVFSETAQRVWLVADGGNVERTYLVSGSKFDNLNPGTYTVQSKARHATALDYSGSMEYFVRFATGYTAPIGFHTVLVLSGGTRREDLERYAYRPELIVASIAQLHELLEEKRWQPWWEAAAGAAAAQVAA